MVRDGEARSPPGAAGGGGGAGAGGGGAGVGAGGGGAGVGAGCVEGSCCRVMDKVCETIRFAPSTAVIVMMFFPTFERDRWDHPARRAQRRTETIAVALPRNPHLPTLFMAIPLIARADAVVTLACTGVWMTSPNGAGGGGAGVSGRAASRAG